MNDTTRRQGARSHSTDASLRVAFEGQMVGPYVLLAPLGRGGLGEVWLGQRASGEYRPEVAIKLIPGQNLDDPEIARRFDRERRILARLNHPDIARLLDAGRFGPGWPYLVMERVHGLALNQAVQELNLAARLKLFVRICRAVQYAHRRLVIHRDLKPSNIMVTEAGEPRLLDFNTAKMLEADDDPELTRVAAPLTPRYASPEQVRGETLTTASDLYSLGVILYELLCNDSPYGDSTSSSYELSRAICETEPQAPSRQGPADHSLDAIVARAMHKDADRRYPTADAFADDIEAWLERRPVSARPVGRMERLRLLLRRHPVASGLIAGLASLVLGASILFFWQMQEARAERDVALEVTGFLETLFEAVDPGSTQFSGDDLIQILDERSSTLRDEPPDDPRIASRLMAALGTVQANFGRPEQAAELFAASWQARNDPEILVRWANARLESGDTDGADELFQQAHAERASMKAAMQAFLGASYAQLKVTQGDIDSALEIAREAAAVAPVGSVDEVYAVDTLAQIHFHAGDVENAASVGERALSAAIDYYGESHLQVATSRNNLALFKGRLGLDAEALALLERATDDFEQLLGPEDPRLATTYSNLGNRRSQQGQFPEAISALERAMVLTRQHYGDDHPWVGLIHGYFGQTYQRMGQTDRAGGEFERALAVLADEPRLRSRVVLAAVANRILLGDLDQARADLAAAKRDVELASPTGHPRRARVLELEALIALQIDDYGSYRNLLARLTVAEAADSDAIRLLEIQAGARTGSCDIARAAWNGLTDDVELKRAALYRTARSALERSCS